MTQRIRGNDVDGVEHLNEVTPSKDGDIIQLPPESREGITRVDDAARILGDHLIRIVVMIGRENNHVLLTNQLRRRRCNHDQQRVSLRGGTKGGQSRREEEVP